MKEFTIIINRNGKEREVNGTLEYLLGYFWYTLEVGKLYENKKGNKKINMNPKSVKSLVISLNNAVSNSTSNGYSSTSYWVK